MSTIYINKSGLNIPIYNNPFSGRVQLRTLFNREAFCLIDEDGAGMYIAFLSSSGCLSIRAILYPSGLVECTDYPYQSNVTIPGDTRKYKIFILRNGASVYTTGGTYQGSAAAGRRVASKTALAGDTKYHLKAINYVERIDGACIPVTGDGVEYGFIDADP